MFDEETLENYKKIEKIVLSKFDLVNESKEVFSKFLYNPDHAIEFDKIASQPDKRLFVKYQQKESDNTYWTSFANSFRNFIKENGITFQNFNDGKVGNKKMSTVFIEHSSSSLSGFLELVLYLKNKDIATFNAFCKAYFPRTCDTIFENINSLKITKTEDERLSIKYGKKTTKKKFNEKEVSILLKSLKTPISSLLNKDFFGSKPFSGPMLCFSLNYTDWFMSSTGESWFSCVDFNNSTGNWRGLAGLIGDKNRILVFATDGNKKNFNGVETFKMKERTWGFLYKDSTTGETRLCANRTYPSGNFDFSKYKEFFPSEIKFGKEADKSYLSAYRFPTLFHHIHDGNENAVKYSSSIAEDSHAKKLVSDNINECYYDTSGGYGIYTQLVMKNGDFSQRTYNKPGVYA